MRRAHPGAALEQLEAGMRKITEEQWIDGPRVSRAKVAEARHLMREVNHVKQCETWVDGPKSQSCRSLTAGNLPAAGGSQTQGYGFMDAHKKTMIRQWVENQTTQVFQSTVSASNSPTALHWKLSQLKQKSLDLPDRPAFNPEPSLDLNQPCFESLPLLDPAPPDGDEDEDSGPSEVPLLYHYWMIPSAPGTYHRIIYTGCSRGMCPGNSFMRLNWWPVERHPRIIHPNGVLIVACKLRRKRSPGPCPEIGITIPVHILYQL